LCPPKQLQTIAANDLAKEMEMQVQGRGEVRVARGPFGMQIGSPVGSHHHRQLHLHAESTNRSRSGLRLGFSWGFSLKDQTQRRRCAAPAKNSSTLEKYVFPVLAKTLDPQLDYFSCLLITNEIPSIVLLSVKVF